MTRRTMTADELAAALGVSPWAVYQAVRQGTCPVPAIRLGRRILFPRGAVEAVLGPLDDEPRP